jgi:hypothetical protein
LTNNLINPHQHGFRPGHSCATNLTNTLELWTKALDDGIAIDNIYLDFAKAFDKFPHNLLLIKLEAYGISGRILNWIKDYLKNQRQRVVINGVYSDWSSVESGVPQGSVFAALLFTLYINDLPDGISSLTALFADDTKLFRLLTTIISHYHLQNDIDILVNWAIKWRMLFNIEKCREKCILATTITYSMLDPSQSKRVNLQSTCCERDLGVYLDKELKFSHHITTKVNKANQILGMIRRTFSHLDSFTFRRLFVSLVRPHLEYCNVISFPKLIKDQKIIENVLRRSSKMRYSKQFHRILGLAEVG